MKSAAACAAEIMNEWAGGPTDRRSGREERNGRHHATVNKSRVSFALLLFVRSSDPSSSNRTGGGGGGGAGLFDGSLLSLKVRRARQSFSLSVVLAANQQRTVVVHSTRLYPRWQQVARKTDAKSNGQKISKKDSSITSRYIINSSSSSSFSIQIHDRKLWNK